MKKIGGWTTVENLLLDLGQATEDGVVDKVRILELQRGTDFDCDPRILVGLKSLDRPLIEYLLGEAKDLVSRILCEGVMIILDCEGDAVVITANLKLTATTTLAS